MAAPKTVLLQKKELRDWWLSVVKKNEFLEVMAFVMAELAHGHSVDQSQLAGARLLQDVMLTIADFETNLMELPGPGLQHDLTVRKEPSK